MDCSLGYGSDGAPAVVGPREIHVVVEEMAAAGLRVLAFARKEMPPDTIRIQHEDLAEGIQFIGLQGMIDPPPPEAQKAVQDCQRAGVLVKMITGDHAGTAAAIGRQLGLYRESCAMHTQEVLTGRDLANFSDVQLVDAAEHTRALAFFP